MQTRELAEKVALAILERGYITDLDVMLDYGVDEFEVIKVKNLLTRYYGIACERWHEQDSEKVMALFLLPEYTGEDGAQLIHRVFHDPGFKTKRRRREEERKESLRHEVREILERLREEWRENTERA